SGLELRDSSVPAVRTSQRGPESESAFGKVESISRCAANAVVLNPADQRLIHTTLINEILKKAPDGIIGDGRNNRGIEPEAALQSARDVILAPTFRNPKCSRG